MKPFFKDCKTSEEIDRMLTLWEKVNWKMFYENFLFVHYRMVEEGMIQNRRFPIFTIDEKEREEIDIRSLEKSKEKLKFRYSMNENELFSGYYEISDEEDE
tara:strand:+ start:96 stop:398 length:303 start_codon:yes stop_codon:yes gene_type:complete